jgi:hypothetical protein
LSSFTYSNFKPREVVNHPHSLTLDQQMELLFPHPSYHVFICIFRFSSGSLFVLNTIRNEVPSPELVADCPRLLIVISATFIHICIRRVKLLAAPPLVFTRDIFSSPPPSRSSFRYAHAFNRQVMNRRNTIMGGIWALHPRSPPL